jgi:hypothetical protein
VKFSDSFNIERRVDHFVVSFSHGEKDEAPSSVVLPITVGARLAIDLFSAMIESMIDLQTSVAQINESVNQLNKVAQDAKAAQDAAQKKAGS